MGRPSVFEEDQEEFLQGRLPGFRVAQGDVMVQLYLNQTYEDYFKRWPPKTTIEEGKKQIYNWYYNKREGKSKKSSKLKGRVIDLTKSAKKTMQAYQAYYKLYRDEITPEIEARWDAALEALPEGAPRPDPFGFRNEVARELYRDEDPDVKAYVEQFRLNGGEIDDDDESVRLKKRSNAIQRLAKTIQVAADAIERDTGWYCSMLLGGIDVDTDEVKSYVFHNGKTPNGQSWDQFDGCFEQINSSWYSFINECFTLEEKSSTQTGKGKAVAGPSSHRETNGGRRGKRNNSPDRSRATSIAASRTSPGPSNKKTNTAAVAERERRIGHNLEVLRGLGLKVDSYQESNKGRKGKGKARADTSQGQDETEENNEEQISEDDRGRKDTEGGTEGEDEDEEDEDEEEEEEKDADAEDKDKNTYDKPDSDEDTTTRSRSLTRSNSRPPRRPHSPVGSQSRPRLLPVIAEDDLDGDSDTVQEDRSLRPPRRPRGRGPVPQGRTQEDRDGPGNVEDKDEEATPRPRSLHSSRRRTPAASSHNDVEEDSSAPATIPSSRTKASGRDTIEDNNAEATPRPPRPPRRTTGSSRNDVEQDSPLPTAGVKNSTKSSNVDTIDRAPKIYISRRRQLESAQEGADEPVPVRSATRPPARPPIASSARRAAPDPSNTAPRPEARTRTASRTAARSSGDQPSRHLDNTPPNRSSNAGDVPRSSRSRSHSPTSLRGSQGTIPPGASEFIQKAAKYLFGISNDGVWINLVNLWVQLEGLLGHSGKQAKLSTKHRPEEISRFMQNARNYDKIPSLAGLRLKPFTASWKLWWGGLQPAWRDTKQWPWARDRDAVGMDWGALLQGGPNGLYLVIVSLAWWFTAVLDKQPQQRKEVLEAVEDVDWVLKNLVDSTDQPHSTEKRKANDATQRAPNKRARK